jgi:uncharacterized Tic20 family protein
MNDKQWAMILHFSVFAAYVIPLAGLVAPILIWQLKKTELPEIDAHGKVVLNWIISSIIYAVVFVLLKFLLIGIPLLIVLRLLCIIFPIIGGIKANNGELWKYPLSIPFLKWQSESPPVSED